MNTTPPQEPTNNTAAVGIMFVCLGNICRSPSAEAILSAAADAKRLHACLDKLSPAHKTVMRLAFYEDMSYSEICQIEGVPEGTVKTRIYHAKQLLLRCLGRR